MRTIQFKNPTGDQVVVELDRREVVPPGGVIDVPEAYARPRQGQVEGKVLPPVIRTIAPQLVPVGEVDKAPMPPAPPRRSGAPTAAELELQGLPPGVAEVAAKKAARDAAKAGKQE